MKQGKVDFDPKAFDAKWEKIWRENKLWEPGISSATRPYYNLMMFPYPSAEGLHVGNMYAFCGSDVYGRFKRMNGEDVLEPIGLDGFGIHSENYAMKIGKHPKDLSVITEKNFYRQLSIIGNAFAWDHKLETYDPDYYKWTQWIFIQLFKAGLAYKGEAEVNWCPSCLTVLADEQVINRGAQNITVCERCGTEVERKKLSQWFFKITDYAQKLLDGLEKIDWSEKVKVAQRNWLGKSTGAEVVFSIDIDKSYLVRIFTTRVDTLSGVTFLALATDHELVTTILKGAKGHLGQSIRDFLDYSSNKVKNSPLKAKNGGEKEGVFTGFYATNPINGEKIPVYIADYVLTGYGTGAVMGVPAHDQRDLEFAEKYGLPIKRAVARGKESSDDHISQKSFTDYGVLVDSGKYSGLDSAVAIPKIVEDLEKEKAGKRAVNWHLRDWIISRQRYWGPPIPMIFCQKCAKAGESWFNFSGPVTSFPPASARSMEKTDRDQKTDVDLRVARSSSTGATQKIKPDWDTAGWYPVPEEDLPVELPFVKNFKPTGSGKSPLAQDENFANVKCPGCGSDAKRETDVSDTFLDSAWYFLRYPSVGSEDSEKSEKSESPKVAWDVEITKKWLPVDMYIGGAEHSVLHLLYSRFITKVFYDLGFLTFDEPFTKFRAHGLLIKDGAKMSKSKGNVVNPDDYIAKYGVDTVRTYLMFCGRFAEGGDFRDEGIEGMQKFLKRVWRIVISGGPVSSFPPASARSREKTDSEQKTDVDLRAAGNPSAGATHVKEDSLFMMHKTIKKVSGDLENLSYNTAISAIMEWMNFLEDREKVKNQKVKVEEIEALLKLLAPFAPFMCEELWQMTHGSLGNKFKSIHLEDWPKYEENLATSQRITLVVQVDGKLRDRIEVERGTGEEEAKNLALKSANVTKYISESSVYRTVFVKDKLINFVTGGKKS